MNSTEDTECYCYTQPSDPRIDPRCNAHVSRYCASCNEREGSEYAKHCCTDDNMIED